MGKQRATTSQRQYSTNSSDTTNAGSAGAALTSSSRTRSRASMNNPSSSSPSASTLHASGSAETGIATMNSNGTLSPSMNGGTLLSPIGSGGSAYASSGGGSSPMSETSPLLRALRNSSSFEESYMALAPPPQVPAPPPSNGNSTSDNGSSFSGTHQFQPISFAEKALGTLLNGVLMYAWCCLIGLALVSLNFEGLLGPAPVNWWLVFLPFWIANGCMLLAHVYSVQHARELREWAENDTMSNEPLLPLLRRIVMIYAISLPLSILLLWSQLAFCARLQGQDTGIYICFAPLLVIQAAVFVRYLLCRSDSTLPGVCWILLFVFTFLLAFQTNNAIRESSTGHLQYPVSWWVVFTPLLTLEALLVACLGTVLYLEFAGVYRMTRWQLAASVLYTLALFTGAAGELTLLHHIDLHLDNLNFPFTFLLAAMVCASVGIYIVARHYVDTLMASRGGAVPVPLTKTAAGWITGHAVVENWIFFGDLALTDAGLAHRNRSRYRERVLSEVETEPLRWIKRFSILSRVKAWWSHRRGTARDARFAPEQFEPERRFQSHIRRTTSGSYSDLCVDLEQP